MRQPYKPNLLQKYQQEHMNMGGLRISLQRTLRVPVGQQNSLPAGLGSFPVFKVSDFKSGCPDEWREDGYFFPMYRQEAMWINFGRGYQESPKALIIGAGNINAISGMPFDPSKNKMAGRKRKKKSRLEIKLEEKQNYLAIPPQPWLDGWKAEDGKVYQFVAAEMGSGETVEGQITGEETVGGIQFIIYDPKDGQKLIQATRPSEYISGGSWGGGIDELLSLGDSDCLGGESEMKYLGGLKAHSFACAASASPPTNQAKGLRSRGALRRSVQSMGLGRGGEIIQKIYPDPHGLEVWREKPSVVEVLYMVSSEDFEQVTGYKAPSTPITMETYQQHGLPWFELHDTKLGDSKGSDVFDKLKPVGEGKAEKAEEVAEEAVKEDVMDKLQV